MSLNEFIFSNARSHRIARHLVFWLCWWLFSACLQLQHHGPEEMGWNRFVLFQLVRSFTRFLPAFLFCYTTIYFLIPRLFKKGKYIYFFLSVCLFVFSLFWITFLNFLGTMRLGEALLGISYGNSTFMKMYLSFYTHISFTGSIPTCCLMLIIKYYKNWYIKQRETEQLTLENKQAELQLLKAQIHPHFLFNTLNNIYAFTLTGSPLAPNLVDRLSGMVDYIASEGRNELVSLEKEWRFVEDYIGLEMVRYGDRLDIQTQVSGDYKNKLIAPMLLIAFVENSFKHGASVMRGKQWIRLTVMVEDHWLDFTLSNSKPAQPPRQNGKGGIGLANVQKRLQLLYPGRHALSMEARDDTYHVHLRLILQPLQAVPAIHTPISELKTVSYA